MLEAMISYKEMSSESAELKEAFLNLLDKDKEFRYAVAGYLGMSEILKRLDKLEEGQNKLWMEVKGLREGQNKLWENQNKLWEEVKSLRENQEKLWENQNKLWENQNKLWEEIKSLRENQEKLWENQNKLWEEIKSLREGQNKLWENQNKLWEEVRSLREGQNKLWENQNKLWEEVKSIREELSLHNKRLSRLERNLGDLVEGYLIDKYYKRLEERGYSLEELRSFTIEGKEVDAILKDGEIILLEASSTVRIEDVKELVEKMSLAEKVMRRKTKGILLGIRVDSNALSLARQSNIEVFKVV